VRHCRVCTCSGATGRLSWGSVKAEFQKGEPSGAGSFASLRLMIGIFLACTSALVTAIFGVGLLAYIVLRITGSPPLPVLFIFFPFTVWLFLGALPLAAAVLLLNRTVVAGHGKIAKRAMQWTLYLGCFLMIAVGADLWCGPQNWHGVFRGEHQLVAMSDQLKNTIVTPHLEVEIVPGNNLLWCGTFQLAWNEACRLAGGDLRFDTDHELVAALNRRAFTKESIDEDSYLAMAGFTRDNIQLNIQQQLQQKFHGQFAPRYLPQAQLTSRPQDFVTYACLHKNLAFPVPFERLDDRLTFGGVRVRAFGMAAYKIGYEAMYPQVLVLDYRSEDDFVIALKTRTADERILLAKVLPENRLCDTVSMVRARAAQAEAQPAARYDMLIVPQLNFDITREFVELQGSLLMPEDAHVANDLYLINAVQNTRVQMNEHGVELRSEASAAFGCAAPPRNRQMRFNKPFLLLLERQNAPMPYLALWIETPELLVPW
jgi:hypothetical protein